MVHRPAVSRDITHACEQSLASTHPLSRAGAQAGQRRGPRRSHRLGCTAHRQRLELPNVSLHYRWRAKMHRTRKAHAQRTAGVTRILPDSTQGAAYAELNERWSWIAGCYAWHRHWLGEAQAGAQRIHTARLATQAQLQLNTYPARCCSGSAASPAGHRTLGTCRQHTANNHGRPAPFIYHVIYHSIYSPLAPTCACSTSQASTSDI